MSITSLPVSPSDSTREAYPSLNWSGTVPVYAHQVAAVNALEHSASPQPASFSGTILGSLTGASTADDFVQNDIYAGLNVAHKMCLQNECLPQMYLMDSNFKLPTAYFNYKTIAVRILLKTGVFCRLFV
jgi:hypothetical protein